MPALTQHPTSLARGIGTRAATLRAPARRCLCAAALLTLAPLCQAQNVQLPAQPTTWSSGTNTVSATSITASGPANASLTINGTAQVTFTAGSQINLEPGFTATAGGTAITFHALIVPAAPITFLSNPSGRAIQVDGATYTTPVTLPLFPGTHTVDASIAQNPPTGTRYNFQSWSDTGAAAHTITASAAATLTVNFTTQYYLTTAASPPAGGTIAPPGGWYDSGTTVAVGVTPNNGYLFSAFSGNLTGSTTPQTLTMTAPASVTATLLPDFAIGTPTGMATMAMGGTTSFPVNVTGPAGYPVTVAFDTPPLPAGFTASFSPTSLTFTGSGSTTMSVTASVGSAGNYILSARGTSAAGPSHSTGINLAVQDFTITPVPQAQYAGSNDTVRYAFAIAGLGGFNSPVTAQSLAFIANPAANDMHCGAPNWSNQWDSGTLTVTLNLFSCSVWNYDIPLNLCGGIICHQSTVHLYVTTGGTFSLTATPTTRSVPQGTNAIFAINVASANGFGGSVGFAQSTFPACAAPTFPPPVTAPGIANLVLGIANCAPGTYGVSIVGAGGSTTASVPVTLVVQGPPAPANIISPNTTSTLSGDSAIFTWDSGSQVTQYQLDLVAADDGTICSPRYTSGTGNYSAAMSLSPCCKRRRPLTATLTSTLASGGAQARSYSYACEPPPGPPNDFTLNLPASVSVDAGFQSSFFANLVPGPGFAGPVTWTFNSSDAITAVAAMNSQPSSANTATATVTAAASVTPGAHQLTVTASTQGAAGISHSTSLTVLVQTPFRAQSETNMGPISLLEYDDQHGLGSYPLLGTLCPTNPTMRACYQHIMGIYHSQPISGVRFMFDLADGLNYPDNGQLNRTWLTNVEAFFKDLHDNSIYRITPNMTTNAPWAQHQGLPAGPNFPPRLPSPYCDPAMYTAKNIKLLRFTPTAPFGEVCTDHPGTDPTTDPAVPCDPADLSNKADWHIDGTINGTSDPYTCAVGNPYFVGWNRIYDVIDAMLQAARDNALTVEEFDAQNEITLSGFPVRGRLIVDNTNNDEDVLGNVASGLRSLRQSMQSHGFDPGRVTYSVMDENPMIPNGECPDKNLPYFGGSARHMELSMLTAALSGGPFGSLSWKYDLPGPDDIQDPYTWTGFACGASTVTDANGVVSPVGASYLTITHSSPTIVDIHSGPCVVLPKYTDDKHPPNAWGQCTPSSLLVNGVSVATWGNVQGEATAMGNALAAFQSSRQQTDPNLANALIMLGETHGRLNPGCLMVPDAKKDVDDLYQVPWDPSTGASTAAGFGSSSLKTKTLPNFLPASLVFRPWEYLQQCCDVAQATACNTPTTNPPYTPVR